MFVQKDMILLGSFPSLGADSRVKVCASMDRFESDYTLRILGRKTNCSRLDLESLDGVDVEKIFYVGDLFSSDGVFQKDFFVKQVKQVIKEWKDRKEKKGNEGKKEQ